MGQSSRTDGEWHWQWHYPQGLGHGGAPAQTDAAYARWLYREIEQLNRDQLLHLKAAIETLLVYKTL